MRETVCIHVGQCGNQIGNKFWNLMLHEHEKTPDNDESLSAFFRFAPSRNKMTHVMKARALLIDMECGPLTETMNGPLGSLFDDTQFVMDVSGAGNNFAQGHYSYGPQYRERFEEGLRRNCEHCDSLQTYLVTHSLGGGTGSGVGTYVMSLLDELYPKIYRYSVCAYPSVDSDVITAPYNTILATNALIEHADCIFPIDNSALFAFHQLELSTQLQTGKTANKYHTAGQASTGTASGNTNNASSSKSKDRGYDDINAVVARMISHLTASSRFHGDMNVDMNEIYTNLIPFPKLQFLMSALSLRVNAPSKNFSVSGNSGAAVKRPAIGSDGSTRVMLQRAFNDILTSRGQITAASPTERGCVTLTSAFLARGKVPLSDFLSCVTTAQQTLQFPAWNPDACKIGMCNFPAPGEESSVLAVYNSTAFGSVLSREMGSFRSLFRARAHVHHYTEYVKLAEIQEAEYSVDSVISDYQDIENHTFPNPATKSKHASRRSRGSAKFQREEDGVEAAAREPWNPNMHQLFPAF